jgi:hypothetical protein
LELQHLREVLAEEGITLGQAMGVLQGRGLNLFLVVLCLPFCTPIPLPGLSTPIGVVVALVGGRMALGLPPVLPERWLKRSLPPRFFSTVLAVAGRLVRWMEWWARPRWSQPLRQPLVRRLFGGVIFLCGLLLTNPLPIPFSNFLPGLTVLILSAAQLEEDFLLACAGLVLFAVTLLFFAGLIWGGAGFVLWLQSRWTWGI